MQNYGTGWQKHSSSLHTCFVAGFTRVDALFWAVGLQVGPGEALGRRDMPAMEENYTVWDVGFVMPLSIQAEVTQSLPPYNMGVCMYKGPSTVSSFWIEA